MKAWKPWLVAVVFGALSVYGWGFFFMVGPAHGPGLELGLVAGLVALVAWRIASKSGRANSN